MGRTNRKERDGLVHLEPRKLVRRIAQVGLTKSALANEANISRTTLIKALRGGGIFPYNANALAKALGVTLVDLLPNQQEQPPGRESPATMEWEAQAYLGPWLTASNGLQFRICRMRNRFVTSRWGRGKWYDLLDPSTRVRENLRHQLIRHPEVCERIGRHPNVTENLSTSPGNGDDSWWVIDRWMDGVSLKDQLDRGPYLREHLPRLMKEIALGLECLHKVEVVFRELAPSRVILSESDGRAVLTDFELAKLMASETVSAGWPDDPYRAPEVEGGIANPRSDLYSWARILLHAATGNLPDKGVDLDAMTSAGLPKAVWRVASDCLAPGHSDRPRSVKRVLREIRRWAT